MVYIFFVLRVPAKFWTENVLFAYKYFFDLDYTNQMTVQAEWCFMNISF